MKTTGAQSLDRALSLLQAIVSDDGRTNVSVLAADLGLAPSSARRMVTALKRHDLIAPVAHGRYAGGNRLSALAAAVDPYRRLLEVSRLPLRRLAGAEGWAVHLGVFRNDMVTYLIKEGGSGLFTREGAELEAYCTGIGKVLLAQLPPAQLRDYLAGPFVRLTAKTICDPAALEADIAQTRERGFAIDDSEMSEAIACVAVPLQSRGHLAAISLSGDAERFPLEQAQEMAGRLRRVAETIAARVSGQTVD